MNNEQNTPKEKSLKTLWRVIRVLFALWGTFSLFYVFSIIFFDYCPPNARCKNHYSIMQSYISNTREQAELYYAVNNNSYKGLCQNEKIVKLMSFDLKRFDVECKDADMSFTIMAKGNNFKYKNRDGFCVDGKGNSVLTKLTTQDGVECK